MYNLAPPATYLIESLQGLFVLHGGWLGGVQERPSAGTACRTSEPVQWLTGQLTGVWKSFRVKSQPLVQRRMMVMGVVEVVVMVVVVVMVAIAGRLQWVDQFLLDGIFIVAHQAEAGPQFGIR